MSPKTKHLGLFAGILFALAECATPALALPPTLAQAGADAVPNMLANFYQDGRWRGATTTPAQTNQDHGDDALTTVLYLKWTATHDPSLPPIFSALAHTAVTYGAACTDQSCQHWSDYPLWDSIAATETWRVSKDPLALSNARAGYDFVANSSAYALGACPDILYQRPYGGPPGYLLKTLETDANMVKAALLLFEETGETRYRDDALRRYQAIRRYYLDPKVPLYSVYVFDDGARCTQAAQRFYASVNGLMIWNGLALTRATGDPQYRAQAVLTARAVQRLSDARGVFADLQAENDVVAPLIEAMYTLANAGGDGSTFARGWIARNAAAMFANRKADGSFERFFDGPKTAAISTSLQTNGGYALAVVGAALAPTQRATPNGWSAAHWIAADASVFPVKFGFTGSRVAAVGTIGEQCCEAGHARVLIDGTETFDHTGVWQNKSNTQLSLPGSVLFAWSWSRSGPHALQFLPGETNGKEGGPFIHIVGYWVVD